MIGSTFLNSAREHSWVGGIVVGVLISVSVQTWADFTSDEVPRLIPYQGVLEYNGEPWDAQPEDVVNSDPRMRFEIYRGSELTDLATCEEHNVQVHNGRFTVLLGEGTPCQGHQPIGEVVREAEDLYVKMTIVNPFPGREGEEVELRNAQRLLPAPFSLWTANATNLNVEVDANVGGVATMGSAVVTGNANVTGNAQMGSAVVTGNAQLGSAVVTGNAQLGSVNVAGDAEIGGNAIIDGQGRMLGAIIGGATITTAVVEGNARMEGTTTITGRLRADTFTVVTRDPLEISIVSFERSLGVPSSTHFCALTRVAGPLAGTDDVDCSVRVSNGQWLIRAADSDCTATCLRFRE